MTKILDAESITSSRVSSLTQKSQRLTSDGLKPKLSIILVGDHPASLLYIRNKERFCKLIQAEFELIKLSVDTSEADFLEKIDIINQDPATTGCFVQLPVPKHLAHIDITQIINPLKDVDGFHLNTINKLYLHRLDGIIPCTPKGIITILKENKIQIEGSNIVIIGRSQIVGRPLSLLLQALNATTTLCHSKTRNLKQHTLNADIIISAAGQPNLITKDSVRHDHSQIVIDVGMNKLNGKTVGDVNFDEVKPFVKAISPVPGGVGPMTVFSLMENLLRTTENILNKE